MIGATPRPVSSNVDGARNVGLLFADAVDNVPISRISVLHQSSNSGIPAGTRSARMQPPLYKSLCATEFQLNPHGTSIHMKEQAPSQNMPSILF
jgi:hypothetical protein